MVETHMPPYVFWWDNPYCWGPTSSNTWASAPGDYLRHKPPVQGRRTRYSMPMRRWREKMDEAKHRRDP